MGHVSSSSVMMRYSSYLAGSMMPRSTASFVAKYWPRAAPSAVSFDAIRPARRFLTASAAFATLRLISAGSTPFSRRSSASLYSELVCWSVRPMIDLIRSACCLTVWPSK